MPAVSSHKLDWDLVHLSDEQVLELGRKVAEAAQPGARS